MKTSSYRRRAILCGLAIAATAGWTSGAAAQARTFSFAYDQPTTTAYGIAANIFDAKLKELSGGTMSINQFPGAQLGQEPQMLQKMRAGDIDFVITSTANASSVAPQAGVFSLHFIFRDQQHLQHDDNNPHHGGRHHDARQPPPQVAIDPQPAPSRQHHAQ